MSGAHSAPRVRTAPPSTAAHRVLADAVNEGTLDRDATDAVLTAVAERPLPPATWPDGLTDREVDVVRQLASGAADKRIAAELGITAKTVAHHIQHIYDKIGVRSRAGATLYALEHRLVRR